MMKSLSELGEADLYWMQPTFKRRFELLSGDDLYATLMFESAFASLATAESAAGSWTFKRTGFFKPRITARLPGAENDLIRYHPEPSGAEGVLAFAEGENYVWKLVNLVATKYGVRNAQGVPLIDYTAKIDAPLDLLKDQARIDITPQGLPEDKLTLLLLMGWYLIVLQQDDVLATAAACVTKATEKKA